jgi:hypothetical protein
MMLTHLYESDLRLLAEMAQERAAEIRSDERSGDPMTAEDYEDLALRCLAEAQH